MTERIDRDEGIDCLGPYRLITQLAKSLDANVFAVRDLENDEKRILRVFDRDFLDAEGLRQQFARRVKALREIEAPNLALLVNHGRLEDGRLYLVHQYVEGPTLRKLIRDSVRLRPEQMERIFTECCRGLQAAWKRGVPHLDIHPDNLIIESKTHAVKVLDTGLSWLRQVGEGDTPPKLPDIRREYLPPEQRDSGRPNGLPSDLYMCAAVFYHFFTGRLPAPGAEPSSPRSLNPDITPNLDAVLLKMLQPTPQDRPPDFDAVLEELQRDVEDTGQSLMAPNASGSGGWTLKGPNSQEDREKDESARESLPFDLENIIQEEETPLPGQAARNLDDQDEKAPQVPTSPAGPSLPEYGEQNAENSQAPARKSQGVQIDLAEDLQHYEENKQKSMLGTVIMAAGALLILLILLGVLLVSLKPNSPNALENRGPVQQFFLVLFGPLFGTEETEAQRLALEKMQENAKRLQFAASQIGDYQLQTGWPPNRLEQLVEEGLLESQELIDAYGRPMTLDKTNKLLLSAGHDRVPETKDDWAANWQGELRRQPEEYRRAMDEPSQYTAQKRF